LTIWTLGVGLGGNGSGVGVVFFAGVLVTVKSPMLGVRLALGEALVGGSVREGLPAVGVGLAATVAADASGVGVDDTMVGVVAGVLSFEGSTTLVPGDLHAVRTTRQTMTDTRRGELLIAENDGS
jgi:hypothetical protein